MSARSEFMQRCQDAQLTIVGYDAVTWALAEIDALRARVVVAEEDSDRLALALDNSWGHDGFLYRSLSEGALEAHSVAVSSRPKADPT